jgi:tetratricopeptide (TPR) repeat protein
VDMEADLSAEQMVHSRLDTQELIAPTSVEFFSVESQRLGDRNSLVQEIYEITGITIQALQGCPLSRFSVNERMSWAAKRETKREEDAAYSLLGIFNIHMPLLYGEGREKALIRLHKEIKESLNEELPTFPPTISLNYTVDSKEEFTFGFHLERVHIIPHFTPRFGYMEALEEGLLQKTFAGRKVFVLYGLGGIGKTQLAIKFAKDHQAKFDSIFFLDGSSQESLLRSFALVYYRILRGKRAQTPGSVLPSKEKEVPPEKMVEEVTQWLAQEQNTRWLLIFDNIDKEPSDEGGFDVVPYFPPKDHGSILITTRLAPLSRLGRGKRVGRMSEEEAVSLLNEILGESSSWSGQQRTWAAGNKESPMMQELLETLDGLPLAISQAGRFINTLNLKLETYLELYTSSKREVMDMLPSDSYFHDIEKSSIRTTWTTSLNLLREKVSKQGPDGDYHCAYRLLQLFAYFDPSDLNYNIIRFGMIGNNVPDWFRTIFSSKLKFFSVITILLDLCLIDNNVSEGSYSMHRVVHDWLCTYVCGETDQELLRPAVSAISYSAPLVMTNEWFVEQQQLALHAIHIFPRLLDLSPDDFLVQYDKMNTEELALVASLLDEPVKCWTLMKFDYTLIGIVRLLEICGRSQEALKLILKTQSRSPETLDDGTMNPVHLLLRYQEISLCGQSHDALPSLSEEFWGVGSPSWAIKAQNIYALKLESASLRHKAVEIWERILNQNRNHTGSVFVHPTWMVFVNLEYRIGDNLERRQQLFEKFETEASREKDKVQQAAWFLEDLDQIRQMRRRQIAISHPV